MTTHKKKACIAVFVGKPGTGKTTAIHYIVSRALEAKRRVLVVTPHDNEWLELPLIDISSLHHIDTCNIGHRIIVHELEEFRKVCELFRHGLLVCEDSTVYIPYVFDRTTQTMLESCDHYDRDFIAVYHGFTLMPPLFFHYATHFCVFATIDKFSLLTNRITNLHTIEQTASLVNRYATTQPHYCKSIINNGSHYFIKS